MLIPLVVLNAFVAAELKADEAIDPRFIVTQPFVDVDVSGGALLRSHVMAFHIPLLASARVEQ